MPQKKTSQEESQNQKISESDQLKQENFNLSLSLLAKDQEQTNLVIMSEIAKLKQQLEKISSGINQLGLILSKEEEDELEPAE